MRFRATAKSSERSNAAGAVELECVPEGLRLVYQGVFALSDGYVPGALLTGSELLVPWPSVVETKRRRSSAMRWSGLSVSVA